MKIKSTEIDMGKDVKSMALVLIETQNEWMHSEGKLHQTLVQDREMMRTSIKNIEAAVGFARRLGMPVAHVGLRFQQGYPELANGRSGLRKAIPQAGTFQSGTFGAEFYETVQPIADEFVVTGRVGASGFSGSNLDSYLRHNNIGTIFIAGYATHVCVESTLREAHDRGYDAFVISDATAAFNRNQQQYFLTEVLHHFGREVSTADFCRG